MIVGKRFDEVLIAGEAESLGVLNQPFGVALEEPLPFALASWLLAQRFRENTAGDALFDLDFQLVAENAVFNLFSGLRPLDLERRTRRSVRAVWLRCGRQLVCGSLGVSSLVMYISTVKPMRRSSGTVRPLRTRSSILCIWLMR